MPPYSSRAGVGNRRQEFVQQVAVRAVQLDGLEVQPVGAAGGGGEVLAHLAQARSGRAPPAAVRPAHRASARARRRASRRGALERTCAPLSHGTRLDALRPAWAIWMPRRDRRDISGPLEDAVERRLLGVAQRPRSPAVMRPSGETAVASMISSPRPIGRASPNGSCASRWPSRPGRILAHRRDDDAVLQPQRAERNG